MADLEGKTIAATYRSMLNVGTASNQELDGTPRVIADGAGNASLLFLSTDSVLISGSGTRLDFSSDGSGEYISGNGTALTLNSGEDINLTCAGGDVNIPANIGLTLGNDGEKIEGDGTDLTIASSALLNLTATTDVVIPVNVGLKFGDGNQHIETDNTDLTITSDVAINLSTPTVDLLVDTNFVTTGGVNGMSIDGTTFSVNGSSNSIGIGTATPGYTLDVVSGAIDIAASFSTSNDTAQIIIEDLAGAGGGDVMYIGLSDSGGASSGGLAWIGFQDGEHAANLNVDTNGYVGIGKTDMGAQLEVVTSQDSAATVVITHTDPDNPAGILIDFSAASNLGANGDYFLKCQDGDGVHFLIDGDGTGTFSGSGTAITSDRRIKTDIIDATAKLDDINKLKVRNFDYIHTNGTKRGNKYIGFIADEFKEVFPSMVRESEIKSFGKEYDDLQSIMDSALIPILVKAVQELSAKVTALENA